MVNVNCQRDEEVYRLLLDAPDRILVCLNYISEQREVGLYEALCGAIQAEAYIRNLQNRGCQVLTLKDGEVKEIAFKD